LPIFHHNFSDGRQTVMFSATWPEEIRSLADKFLKKDVVRVVVGGEELSANHKVKQIVECVTSFEKDRKLVNLLENYHKGRKNRLGYG
jgi:ATP-dependent RNA helicase DBP3